MDQERGSCPSRLFRLGKKTGSNKSGSAVPDMPENFLPPPDCQPGDEYILVDEFAAALRLQRWYVWQKDEELPPEEGGGTTNEELLQSKAPASVMYCLSALQRFENIIPFVRKDFFYLF